MNLYKQSIEEKWQWVYDHNKRKDMKMILEVNGLCAFCYDVINNNGFVKISASGRECAKHCKIDKSICGSKKSLMYKLIKCKTKKMPKLIKKIYEEIKKRAG